MERQPACHHVVEHHSQAEQVGPLIHLMPQDLFRAHVFHRPHDQARDGVGLSAGRHVLRRLAPDGAASPARSPAPSLCPRGVSMILAGLMSRWMIPLAWASSSASAAWMPISRTTSSGRGPPLCVPLRRSGHRRLGADMGVRPYG